MSFQHRMDQAFSSAPHLTLNNTSRYVLFSDCHRGRGNHNDNFLKNQHIFQAALQFYYENNFTYLELGDGDELWENFKMDSIIDIHSNIFRLFELYHRENRLYLLYGNHDIEKQKAGFCSEYFESHYCTEAQCRRSLMPKLRFYEGIILENQGSPGNHIYLTHGHQASLLNSTLWPLARFLVRFFWLPIEKYGVNDPTSAAKNYSAQKKAEEKLNLWATQNRHILITGHTHRPILHSNQNTYFNTGSCIHPSNITCIEIQRKTLTLVKWYMSTRNHQSVFIAREPIAGPFEIDKYYEAT